MKENATKSETCEIMTDQGFRSSPQDILQTLHRQTDLMIAKVDRFPIISINKLHQKAGHGSTLGVGGSGVAIKS